MLRRAQPALALTLLALSVPPASCGDSGPAGSGSGNDAGVPRTVGGSVPASPLTQEDEDGYAMTGPSAGVGPDAPKSVYGSVPAPHAQDDRAPGTAADAPLAQVVFTVRDGRLTPPQLTLPAHSAAELVLVSGDDAEHTATLRAGSTYSVTARPGAPGAVALPALRPGEYRIVLGSSSATLLVQPPP